MGISSPRKTMNTYSGGILWMKTKSIKIHQPVPPYIPSISAHIKNRIFNCYPSFKYSLKKMMPINEDQTICKYTKQKTEE